MGQRHQIFVIARVKTNTKEKTNEPADSEPMDSEPEESEPEELDDAYRYRTLAVLHHQWLYGTFTIDVCARLLELFSSPVNHPALKAEMRSASKFNHWDMSARKRHSLIELRAFPFVDTLLDIGIRLGGPEGMPRWSDNIIPEPYCMEFDEGDNNDGITVLDITDPENVRYCFAFLEDNVTDPSSAMTPLLPHEYAKVYDEEYTDQAANYNWFKRCRLIDHETLNNIWPSGDWDPSSVEEQGNPENSDSTNAATEPRTLQSLAIDRLVDTALNEPSDTDPWWIEMAEQYGRGAVMSALRARLLDDPIANDLSRWPSSISLLARIFHEDSIVDLSPFTTASKEQILSVVNCLQDRTKITTLNLSNNENLDEELLTKIFALLPRLSVLYCLATPELSLQAVANALHAQAVPLRDLYHTEHLQQSFCSPWRYGKHSKPSAIPFPLGCSPVRQIVFLADREDFGGFYERFNPSRDRTVLLYSATPLYDTVLPPEKVVWTLAHLIKFSSSHRFPYLQEATKRSAVLAASLCSTAPSTVVPSLFTKIGARPPLLTARKRDPNGKFDDPVDEIRANEWTLCVKEELITKRGEHDYVGMNAPNPQKVCFAFVTMGENGVLRAVGVKEFLDEVVEKVDEREKILEEWSGAIEKSIEVGVLSAEHVAEMLAEVKK